jgi:hypothetical protein
VGCTLAFPMLVRSVKSEIVSAMCPEVVTKSPLMLTEKRHKIQKGQPGNDHEVEPAHKLLVLE